MKSKNLFWGAFLIIAAVLIIASQTVSFVHIGFWSILASVVLAAILIDSLVKLNFFGIFFPLALLYLIYWQPLNLFRISFWLLLLAAVLLSMGFSFLFSRHPYHSFCNEHHWDKDCAHTSESLDGNTPCARVSFGAASKYLHGDCIKSGQFSASFGALEVYFDQAQLSPDGAEIYLDCSFGAIKLYVPKNWRVIENLSSTLGGVNNDTRFNNPSENAPQLTITGSVSFSGVEIYYV
jgi:predicted membrane protein